MQSLPCHLTRQHELTLLGNHLRIETRCSYFAPNQMANGHLSEWEDKGGITKQKQPADLSTWPNVPQKTIVVTFCLTNRLFTLAVG
jgi:hypothetical protein